MTSPVHVALGRFSRLLKIVGPAPPPGKRRSPSPFPHAAIVYNSSTRNAPEGPGMSIPRLRAPIVLVHGLCGCGSPRRGPWRALDYFHGVMAALEAAGNRVLAARLSPTGGVARRAAQLKAFLDRHAPGEAVHLIAHSMGGLDSRYMISRL